ncbi:MAG: TRAP-type C4-dicarboxylate transport system substrate-binding protein [Planctomycetota bacterium]|jgi:TRAP-type C4-dicarboxylate transport system substrate-binding protein
MGKIMKIMPRLLLAMSFSFAFGAIAQGKTLKIATLAPAGTTWMKLMTEGADSIKEKTGGRVKLKFYPGGVMGNDLSVHRKIKVGQLHGGAFTPGGLSHINTSIQALSLPMVFDSYDEADYVRAKMQPVLQREMEASGFVILGISEGGFARILSKHAMQNLQAIRDSKVWIPNGDKLAQLTFNALGISPVSLPISDVFTGLQTGLIETVAVNPTGAIAFQWHNSTAFMTETPITFLIGVLAVEEKAFSQLTADDQQVVRAEMQAVFSRMDKLNRNDDEAALAALQQQGIALVAPQSGEIEKWKSLSNAAIESMVGSGAISADIVSQVKKHLSDFRKSQ